MKQEHKELLLKDLSARLFYGVRVRYSSTERFITATLRSIDTWGSTVDLRCIPSKDNLNACFNSVFVDKIKPYLFPLSSMTEEQKEELNKKYLVSIIGNSITLIYHSEGYWDNDNECEFIDYLWLTNWLLKNHFDIYGLIPKGLAIDATNLNIY